MSTITVGPLTVHPERLDEAIEATRAAVAELSEFLAECRRRSVDPSDVIELIEAGVSAEAAIAQLVTINAAPKPDRPSLRRLLRRATLPPTSKRKG